MSGRERDKGTAGMGKEKRRIRQKMRRDCARLMAPAIAASFFECLLTMAAPMAASILLGNLADYLLALDREGIRNCLPAFAAAIFIEAILTPGVVLGKNLLLTRQGTAYDVFLMNSTLHMPQKSLHSIDSGDFMYRFEGDRTMYYITIMRLFSCPAAVVCYGILFVILLRNSSYHALYCICIVFLSALAVLYDSAVARRQASLKKETADYESSRTELELELLMTRDFSHGFGLDSFMISRLHNLFACYWRQTGEEQAGKNAVSTVFQYLCDYGVPVSSVLIGAILVVRGQLTVGALLGGYLLIPTIKQGWNYVRQTVNDVQGERKYGTRMAYFYQDPEPNEKERADWQEPDSSSTAAAGLILQEVSFSYGGQEQEAVSHVNISLSAEENIQLTGPNGCGKSTLGALISGVYMPDQGKICDGTGKQISLEDLRRRVALQEQNSVVFTGTVWENLFLPETKREEAGELLKAFAFEKTLNDRIEGDGRNLSPGERKKVLLVRALLKEAPFLLLDEPLNHLDAQGRETLIRQLIRKGKGLILISHEDFLDGYLKLRHISMSDGKLR